MKFHFQTIFLRLKMKSKNNLKTVYPQDYAEKTASCKKWRQKIQYSKLK